MRVGELMKRDENDVNTVSVAQPGLQSGSSWRTFSLMSTLKQRDKMTDDRWWGYHHHDDICGGKKREPRAVYATI